eukprot:2572456-Lingulodinium_polyedra.AAC.1
MACSARALSAPSSTARRKARCMSAQAAPSISCRATRHTAPVGFALGRGGCTMCWGRPTRPCRGGQLP